MNFYILYDIVLMFVNDVVCDRDIVSSGKEIPVLRLLGCALFGDSKEVSWLYWYIGFTWMKITSWWRVEGGLYGPVQGLKYEPNRNRLFW